MKDRALAFDNVPMTRGRIWTQSLCGARNEVGNYRVDGDTGARDEDPGLTGCTKIGIDPALLKFECQRQRRVFLPQRTIGANCEQSLAGALATSGDGNVGRGRAYVDQSAAQFLGDPLQRRRVFELAVRAADNVEPGFECFKQRSHPAVADNGAHVSDADDERACAPSSRLAWSQRRKADTDARSWAGEFAYTAIRRPLTQAVGSLSKGNRSEEHTSELQSPCNLVCRL